MIVESKAYLKIKLNLTEEEAKMLKNVVYASSYEGEPQESVDFRTDLNESLQTHLEGGANGDS